MSLHDRPSRSWPELADAPAGDVTLRELATHTAGLPRDGAHFKPGVCWVLGTGCFGTDAAALASDLRGAALAGRGAASYSNLGIAALGTALERATGLGYADLIQRITGPLGMTETRPQSPSTGPLAPRGHAAWGLRPANEVMDAYAPSGGLVSTASDLGRYLGGLLDGTAPGQQAALASLVDYPDAPAVGDLTGTRVGLCWFSGDMDGRRVAFHTGETPGYRSVLIVDAERGRAVGVLSNVDGPVGRLAQAALRAG